MRLVHVVPHIDREASGPSYSVPRLCQNLAEQGNDVELMCLAAAGSIPSVTLTVHGEWPVLKRLAVSPSLARAIWRKSETVDVVHNHSLWSMVNIASGWAVPGHRAKLVTSPRGTLSAWALSRRREVKRLMWPLQRRALEKADLLHATSVEEFGQIRALGLKAPVAIIPNGIDLPPQTSTAFGKQAGLRTALFLSRIHPTKGLDRLLHAWSRLEARYPDWRLVIAGRGEPAHVAEVHALARRLNLARVDFPGPLYGEAKAQAYRGAQLFVLPTHSENFGLVVAEALAHGCPALVSRGAPWAGLEVEQCGWWVSNEIDCLTAAIETAIDLPPFKLAEMGIRGRNWMARDFGWVSIAQSMVAAYRWLREGGVAPTCIRTY